jgi:hypothetical protein
VPPTRRPPVPALSSVPSIVTDGPPGDNVVPSTMIASPLLEGIKAVIVLPPKVKTAYRAMLGVGVD